MDNKEKYRQLCKKETSIPIFSRDWWLDATAGIDNWDVVLVEKGGEVVASMPYMISKRYGFKYLCQPILTQKLGPWLKYPYGQKYTRKLEYEKEIFTMLIDKLPEADSFSACFDYNITNWLPFYWKGFEQTTRYTYVIEPLLDIEKIKNGFSHAKRQNIRKAENMNLQVCFDLSCAEFYNHHRMTLSKQNVYDKKIVYSYEIFEKIYNAAYSNNAGRVIYAKDVNGNIHSALFVIWDSNSAYDLISTIDPDYRSFGSATMLVWKMMQYLSDKTKAFDFEGSMIEGVENSFRQFGAVQKPYIMVSKIYTKKLKIIKDLRKAILDILD